MEVPRVEVYERKDGGFDWRLIGINGEQLCESSQGYTERGDAREGWIRVEELILEHFEQSGTIAQGGSLIDVDRNGQRIA